MPTYVFSCEKCKLKKEIVRKITDESPVSCEICSEKMSIVIQPVGFILAGSGWSKDGYK